MERGHHVDSRNIAYFRFECDPRLAAAAGR